MVRPTTNKNNGNSSGIYSNNILHFARNATNTNTSNNERYENVLSILDQVIAIVQEDESFVEYTIEDVDSIDGDSLEDEEIEDVLSVPYSRQGNLGWAGNGGFVADDATRTNISTTSNSTGELLLQPSGVASHEGDRHYQGSDLASSTSTASPSSSLFDRNDSTVSPSSSSPRVTNTPATRNAVVSTTALAMNSTIVAFGNITNGRYIDNNGGRQPATLSEDGIEEEEEEG